MALWRSTSSRHSELLYGKILAHSLTSRKTTRDSHCSLVYTSFVQVIMYDVEQNVRCVGMYVCRHSWIGNVNPCAQACSYTPQALCGYSEWKHHLTPTLQHHHFLLTLTRSDIPSSLSRGSKHCHIEPRGLAHNESDFNPVNSPLTHQRALQCLYSSSCGMYPTVHFPFDKTPRSKLLTRFTPFIWSTQFIPSARFI
jgi:hypothetical protein